MKRRVGTYRLLTRDPASGEPLIVTRLECPASGVVIEGEFDLGWIGLLTPDQLDFVGGLLRNRGNVQRLATELGVAYNTARNRLDDIVQALGGPPDQETDQVSRAVVLDRLATHEITPEEAIVLLRDR
ncbi:MAG TPA: DUF2089 domain-containing protein [Chloroflexota bacterium]|nr:DUF2089 domain-containing protein [Chloroflexota bacterium]